MSRLSQIIVSTESDTDDKISDNSVQRRDIKVASIVIFFPQHLMWNNNRLWYKKYCKNLSRESEIIIKLKFCFLSCTLKCSAIFHNTCFWNFDEFPTRWEFFKAYNKMRLFPHQVKMHTHIFIVIKVIESISLVISDS